MNRIYLTHAMIYVSSMLSSLVFYTVINILVIDDSMRPWATQTYTSFVLIYATLSLIIGALIAFVEITLRFDRFIYVIGFIATSIVAAISVFVHFPPVEGSTHLVTSVSSGVSLYFLVAMIMAYRERS